MSKFHRTASLFIVGVKDFRWNSELASFLKDYPVGGLALFNSPFDSPDNIWKDKLSSLEMVHDFVSRVQSLVRFISADQEGGRVRRLRGAFIPLPSAQMMAEAFKRNPHHVAQTYEIAAQQMQLSQIRLNFAPVCDIRYPESNNVIGDRSFGSTRESIEEMAKVFCEAFERNGVRTTLKHFPGHGPSRFDSHEQIARLFKTPAEMKKEDTRLFKSLAPYASAVMTAHIGFDDDDDLPFSINPKLFEDFQDSLPSGKILITDDLQNMKAVSDKKPWVQALRLPYDFILLCGTLDQAASAIEESIRAQEAAATSFSSEQAWEARVKRSESQFETSEPIVGFGEWKDSMLSLEQRGLELIQGISHERQS